MGHGHRPAYPGLAGALARAAAAETAARTRAALHRSLPWRLALSGPLPAGLSVTPDALVSATLEGAQDILRGRFTLESGILDVRAASPFDLPAPGELRAELHGFAWLAHLERAGGKTAHFVARALVEDWIDRHERPDETVWAPHVLGQRLVQWAAQFRFLTGDHDLIFRSRLLKTMAEQARHLARTVEHAPAGPLRLAAAAALVTIDAAIPEGAPRSARAVELLRRAIEGAVLPDGGIVTRSPDAQLRGLADLVRTGRALTDARRPLPPFLAGRAEAMQARLASVVHGDGRLACFNGASEGDAALIAELLGGEAAGEGFAPEMGYARLAARDTLALFDCGGPPPGPQAIAAHAAPLSFELSHEAVRIVVNGGVAHRRGGEWRDAARRTAAHAALEIGGCDAGALLEGFAARHLGPRLYGGRVNGGFEASEEGSCATGEHDLYRARFGVSHRRRLFLGREGGDLRGEDTLARPGGRGGAEIAIRFPLHPDCRATLAQSGDSVLIVPPTGEPWRFRASLSGAGERLALEPALYMGGETVRKTEAITVRSALSGAGQTMRWAFHREVPHLRPRRRLV